MPLNCDRDLYSHFNIIYIRHQKIVIRAAFLNQDEKKIHQLDVIISQFILHALYYLITQI